MSVEPSSWQAIAARETGDLSEIPYAVLLTALARARRSAVVEMAHKPVEKRIVIDDGAPVDCRSNLAHETLSRFLLREGHITAEQFHPALADSLSRAVPIGEVLIERGLATPQLIYRSMQQNLARKLLDGFTWNSGSFRLVEAAGSSDAEIRVNPAQLILTGVQKLCAQEEIVGATAALEGERLAFVPGSSPVAEFRPRGVSLRLVEILQAGPSTFAELQGRAGLLEIDLRRVLYGLHLLELIVPESQLATLDRATEEPTTPEAPPVGWKPLTRTPLGAEDTGAEEPGAEAPAEPVAEATALSAEELLLLRSKVFEAFLSYRRRDALEFLGLSEEANLQQVEAAYLEISETFAPWGLGFDQLDEDQDKARTLFLTAAKAYAELRDPDQRRALLSRRKLARECKEADKNKQSDIRIDTQLLDPDVQYRKGLDLLASGAVKKAVATLEFAADCDPQNPLYRSEVAHARYQLDPQLHAVQATSELKEVLRNQPNYGLANYYLGLLHADQGSFDEAEELLRRSIKLMAPDRRPIEALRELSTKKRKK